MALPSTQWLEQKTSLLTHSWFLFSHPLHPTRQQIERPSPLSLSLHFSSIASTNSKPRLLNSLRDFSPAFTLACLNPFFTNRPEQSFPLNQSMLISFFERNPLMAPLCLRTTCKWLPPARPQPYLWPLWPPPAILCNKHGFLSIQQANPFVLSAAAWKEHSPTTFQLTNLFQMLLLMLPWKPLQTFFSKDSLLHFSSYWFRFVAFFSTGNYLPSCKNFICISITHR